MARHASVHRRSGSLNSAWNANTHALHQLPGGGFDLRNAGIGQCRDEAGGIVEPQPGGFRQRGADPFAQGLEQFRTADRVQVLVQVLGVIHLHHQQSHGEVAVGTERLQQFVVARQAGDGFVAVEFGEPLAEAAGVDAGLQRQHQLGIRLVGIDSGMSRGGFRSIRRKQYDGRAPGAGGERSDLLGLVGHHQLGRRLAGV